MKLEGHRLRLHRLANDAPSLPAFCDEGDGPHQGVREASRTWGTLDELLVGLEGVVGVTLAHEQKVQAIAEAQITTDKIDAATRAQWLRANLRPASESPSVATRLANELGRQRVFVVRRRTRVTHRLQGLLARRRVPRPAVTGLVGKRGLASPTALAWEGVEGERLREHLVRLVVGPQPASAARFAGGAKPGIASISRATTATTGLDNLFQKRSLKTG